MQTPIVQITPDLLHHVQAKLAVVEGYTVTIDAAHLYAGNLVVYYRLTSPTSAGRPVRVEPRVAGFSYSATAELKLAARFDMTFA